MQLTFSEIATAKCHNIVQDEIELMNLYTGKPQHVNGDWRMQLKLVVESIREVSGKFVTKLRVKSVKDCFNACALINTLGFLISKGPRVRQRLNIWGN